MRLAVNKDGGGACVRVCSGAGGHAEVNRELPGGKTRASRRSESPQGLGKPANFWIVKKS